MRQLILVFLLFFPLYLFSQHKELSVEYFRHPLDITPFLSGNFGELRDNHFHSGLDYKTLQKEGLNVYAGAEGYISRIKISQFGYGKTIYITHSNGFTTLYGHLKSFNPTLESYIKKIQYEHKNYEIEVFPKPDELIVTKGEIIAFSGNTGSSGGPHLHFEIRETNNQIPYNPIPFGLDVKDTTKPIIQYLYAYPLTKESQVNQSNTKVQINIKKDSLGNYISDTVYASGKIGFAVNAYDQQDGDDNRNGIYNLLLKNNGKNIYHFKLDKFSFDETKFINLHIDYENYMTNNSRLQKCFIEPFNSLSNYDRTLTEHGFIDISDEKIQNLELTVGDIEGNETIIKIVLIGKNDPLTFKKQIEKTNYHLPFKESKIINLGTTIISFSKYTFYHDVDLNITKNADGSVQIHQDRIPLTKNFTISFDLSTMDKESIKHSFVAKIEKKGSISYISSELKDQKLIGKAKVLGKYAVVQDFKAPTILPINFKNEQWISNLEVLQVKINDELSGIKSYTASINNQWVLMERNHNTGILSYNFKDLTFEGSKHNFKIVVTDNAHNTKTYTATFYRE